MSVAESALELPVGDRDLPARSFTLGALSAGAAGLALIGSLIAAYIGLRSSTSEWLPEDFEVDAFLGVILTLTALMAGTFAAWAPLADGRGQRRQAAAALSLASFIGVCLLNGIWYLGTQLGLGAVSSPYATVNYALLGATAAFLGAGVAGLLAALAKVGGRQAGPTHPGPVRAATWLFLLSLVGWVAVWSTLFLLK